MPNKFREEYIVDNLGNCFSEYHKFSTKDLITSLSNEGRDFTIIRNFLDVFIFLTKDTFNMDNKQRTSLNTSLSKLLNEYTESYAEIINISEIKIHKNDLYCNLFEKCNSALNKFVDAISLYEKSTYNKVLHFQALIEFNNFLSHIYKFSITKEDINIERVISHLYRGSLDAYKTIIINNYNTIDKNSLAQLRYQEIDKIGKIFNQKHSSSTNHDLLEQYKLCIKDHCNLEI